MGRTFEICIDAIDADRLRPFWAEALGYRITPTEEGALDLVDPAGVGPTLWFQLVTEPKRGKNRVHLDVWLAREEVLDLQRRLVDLGGAVTAEHDQFLVLTDPEGNELCLCWPEEVTASTASSA